MIPSLRYITLVCIVFFDLGQVVNGITCYSCITCGSNGYGTTSSTSSNSSCYKYVHKILGIVSSTDRGILTPCTEGSDIQGSTYYCCSTDNCNGSISLSNSLYLTFIFGSILIFLKRMINN